MVSWLAANGSTIIIAVILLVLVFFAGRKVIKNKGGCSSCGGCKGGCEGCRLYDPDGKKEKELFHK